MPKNNHLHNRLAKLSGQQRKWNHSLSSWTIKRKLKLNNLSFSCNTLVSFSHTLIAQEHYSCTLPKCNSWCYLPFIITSAIIMALRPQGYYLQIIMRTGENYFFFHFDITFVKVQINSVSSGNTYSYITLRNMLCNSDFSVFWYTSFLSSSSLYIIPW